MAEKEKLDLGEEKPKSSSKRLIFIVVGAVIVTLLAVFAALYFLGIFPAKESGGHGKAQAEKKEQVVEKPVIYLPLAPPFAANFKNNPEARLVQIEISLAARDQKVLDALTRHMPMLRNNILMVLGGDDPAVLKTAEGKAALRGKIKEEIKKILSEQSEFKEGVEDVYFTGFVMQ